MPSFDDYLSIPLVQDDVVEKVQYWRQISRNENMPVICLDMLYAAVHGDEQAMLSMIQDFVRLQSRVHHSTVSYPAACLMLSECAAPEGARCTHPYRDDSERPQGKRRAAAPEWV